LLDDRRCGSFHDLLRPHDDLIAPDREADCGTRERDNQRTPAPTPLDDLQPALSASVFYWHCTIPLRVESLSPALFTAFTMIESVGVAQLTERLVSASPPVVESFST